MPSFQDVETQPLAKQYHYEHRGLPLLSRKHILYLILAQGLGPAVVSGTVNFAIACAMYRTTHGEIRVWPLNKHTIAGDLGVTIIIQSILSTVIASILIRGDVRAKREKPLSRPWPDVDWWREQKGFMKWIGLAFCFLSLERDLLERKGFKNFLRTLFITTLQGFAISVLFFPIFWPLAIAIVAPLYGGINMQGTWIPEVIKAIFGAVLSLFMNPLLAALILGAEAHKPALSRIKNADLPPQTRFNGPVLPIAAHLSNEVTR